MQTLYTNVTFSFLKRLEKATLNNDIEQIIQMGVSKDEANTIASFRPVDVFKLSRIYQIIDISIDETALEAAIKQAGEGTRSFTDNESAEIAGDLLRALSSLSTEPESVDRLQKHFSISEPTIYKLSSLTLIEIANIIRTGIVFYEISANEEKLSMAVEYVEQLNKEEATVEKLLSADASWPMVSFITGMSKNTFQAMRKRMDLPSRVAGAPKQLTEEQSSTFYYAWTKSKDKPFIERCLEVHEATQLSLRQLWPRIEELHRMENGEKVSLI